MSSEPLDQPESAEYGLVMPFVVVTSKGGPYDDDAFTAGYSAGSIDANLAMANHLNADRLDYTVRTGLLPQLDLIAMRHGYTMTRTEVEATADYEAMPEWTFVRFQRGTDD